MTEDKSKTSAGSSPALSAESNFRELADVFLQNQTKIWLGEVLHIRFDEETSISDLLADGELLFKLSKVLWKRLLKKNIELKNSKVHIYEKTSFGKNDGKYMAYPKIDSFLKICQILGLTGIDLFSPSDVVEKRHLRRVCMCIRSLSKKARLKGLNVPDFEIVTYTVAMPTDMVCGIKKTLEKSQSSSPNSASSSSPSMERREIYRQRSSSGLHIQNYDSHSESDGTESTLAECEFQSHLSVSSYDDSNLPNIIGENSPEENWMVDGNLSELHRQYSLDTPDIFTSAYEDALYELDEPVAVDPEDAFMPFHDMLLSEGCQNQSPDFTSSVCNGNLDSSPDSITGDNGMESQEMSKYKDDVSNNAELKIGNMSHDILLSEVLLLKNCISEQPDATYITCQGINVLAKEAVDRRNDENILVDQVDFVSSVISEKKFKDSANSRILLPQVNNPSEIQMPYNTSQNTINEHADIVVDKVDTEDSLGSPSQLNVCEPSENKNSLTVLPISEHEENITGSIEDKHVIENQSEVDVDLTVQLRQSCISDRFIKVSAEKIINAEDNECVKNIEELDEPELKPTRKSNDKAKGKKMVKSLAAAMTLLGAIFFVQHIRQKKNPENGNETIKAQQQDKNSRFEAPKQKQAEVGKSDVLYPGGRFKF